MEIRFLSDCPIYDKPAGVPRSYAKERDVVNSLSVAKHGWIEIPGGWVNSYWPSVQIMREIPEETPQTPNQAGDTSVQPTAVTVEDVLKLIRFHNLTVATFERVGKAVKVDGWLFGGMEMWHRIACEGAEIVGMARRLGIDATINMQTGLITVKGQ